VNVTPNIVGTFEAQNILNDKSEFYAGEEFRPRAIYDNGRVYYLGARFKF
jgi:iron complex outermembrane receptor protein